MLAVFKRIDSSINGKSCKYPVHFIKTSKSSELSSVNYIFDPDMFLI